MNAFQMSDLKIEPINQARDIVVFVTGIVDVVILKGQRMVVGDGVVSANLHECPFEIARRIAHRGGEAQFVLEEAILKNPHLWILFFDFWDCALSLDLARKGFVIFEQSGRNRDLTAV